MNNSKKIILFILIILLTIPPFFNGGTNIFIKGTVFVLAGLAGLLFIFGVKSVGHLMGRPTLVARTIAPQSAVRLHTEYGASESHIGGGAQGELTTEQIPQAPFIKGRVVVFIFLFLFLLFSLISVFFSVSPYESAVIWLESLSYAVLFFIAVFSRWEKKEIDFLIKIFLAVSGLLCLVGIYFYIIGSYSRLTSLFWWPNPFAGYLLFSLFLGIDWIFVDNCHCEEEQSDDEAISVGATAGIASSSRGGTPRNDSKIFPILFLSIIFSSFILTGSRGAFLSFLIVLPVYFYFKFKSPYAPFIKGEQTPSPYEGEGWGEVVAQAAITTPPPLRPSLARRGIIGKSFIRILAVIFLSIFLVFIINSLKNDDFGFASHIKESGTQNDFSSGIRLNYWRGAWEMFKDRPLTGWGAGTFGTIYHLYQKDPISSGKYAHNWYLEMLAEQGIFTTIFFVLFLVSVLFTAGFGQLANKPLSLLRRGGGEVLWGAAKQGYAYQVADAAPCQTSPNPSLVRRGSFALPLFAGILAFLIHNGVDIDWHFGANAIVFWIFLGLLYNVSREKYFVARGALSSNRHCEEPASGDEAIPASRANRDCFPRIQCGVAMTILLVLSGIILLHGGYFYEQGLRLKEEGKLTEAGTAFKKSVFLNSDPDYLRELGIIKYSRALNTGGAAGVELLNQALAISEKIMKYDSYDALNYELAGRVYLARGDSGEAEKNFRKAVELNKFNLRHYINLISLLISENRKEEAKDLINKILFYYPEEVVNNRKAYIMANQEITSGIENDIEYLKYLLNNI